MNNLILFILGVFFALSIAIFASFETIVEKNYREEAYNTAI
jgi:hypothetical protein